MWLGEAYIPDGGYVDCHRGIFETSDTTKTGKSGVLS